MTRATVGHDFGSTDSTKVTIGAPVAEVDTYDFNLDIVAGGKVTLNGGTVTTDNATGTYQQDFITSHKATLDSLVKKINDNEQNFKAARVDSK
ncbi:MAG: hypothetical protein ACKVJ2_15225, partial [Pseudomonadales bacterium]